VAQTGVALQRHLGRRAVVFGAAGHPAPILGE
jgi:hypothetical protein